MESESIDHSTWYIHAVDSFWERICQSKETVSEPYQGERGHQGPRTLTDDWWQMHDDYMLYTVTWPGNQRTSDTFGVPSICKCSVLFSFMLYIYTHIWYCDPYIRTKKRHKTYVLKWIQLNQLQMPGFQTCQYRLILINFCQIKPDIWNCFLHIFYFHISFMNLKDKLSLIIWMLTFLNAAFPGSFDSYLLSNLGLFSFRFVKAKTSKKNATIITCSFIYYGNKNLR